MRQADLAPGQKFMRLSSAGDVESGDVLGEWGPRIGNRWWLVVHIEKARRYWHAAVRRVSMDEAKELVHDGGTYWSLTSTSKG